MRILLKQAAHLCGKDYARGVHEFSAEVLESKFFHQLVKAGMAVDPDEAKVISAESIDQRQNKIVEKILASAKPKAKASEPAPAPSSIDQALGEEPQAVMEPEESSPESEDESEDEGDFFGEEESPESEEESQDEPVAKEAPPKKKKKSSKKKR